MSQRARILVAALELDFQFTEERQRDREAKAVARCFAARTSRQNRRARKTLNRVFAGSDQLPPLTPQF